ncbi:Multidrug resistance protein MdtE [BD1-7 clade bacterium]|uniref:Multidrug resistance protein MdtE n=1 Tax=BD1-7 clade bacterium TaxID=2029982 RepID=A0A5S9PQN7_9GAMM|nr:Multidrug resistance protein MdtE [BD1-7 clade bacterium]
MKVRERHMLRQLSWVSVIIVAVSLSCGCAKKHSEVRPLPVRVAVVKAALNADGLSYSASIQPQSQVNVSFRTDGYIREIETRLDKNNFERILQPGDKVSKGEALAHIDTRQYDDNLQQADAQLSSARADLLAASATFRRAKALQKTASITGTDFDGAKRQYSSAEANVSRALASVDEAQLRLSETSLIAPFEGTILKRLIEVGTLVHAGTPGFVLANTRSVKAVFGVPDTVLSAVQLGASIAVMADAYPQQVFSGRVTDIGPAANERTRVFDITVTLANPGDELKPGMVTSLVLPLEIKHGSGVIVPLSSMVENPNNGNFSVFIVESGEPHPLAKRQDVKTSRVIGNNILVTEGLEQGQRVISTGANRVHDGQSLNVVE